MGCVSALRPPLPCSRRAQSRASPRSRHAVEPHDGAGATLYRAYRPSRRDAGPRVSTVGRPRVVRAGACCPFRGLSRPLGCPSLGYGALVRRPAWSPRLAGTRRGSVRRSATWTRDGIRCRPRPPERRVRRVNGPPARSCTAPRRARVQPLAPSCARCGRSPRPSVGRRGVPRRCERRERHGRRTGAKAPAPPSVG